MSGQIPQTLSGSKYLKLFLVPNASHSVAANAPFDIPQHNSNILYITSDVLEHKWLASLKTILFLYE